MARSHRTLAVAALAATVLAAPAAVQAQSYRTLHVDALSMRADKTMVAVGETFHLAIHARIREKLQALDELVIPGVGTMHVLGDERHVSAGPNGTDVTETLTLEPTTPGPFTFAPAYLDAIDAKTRKPLRFSSNPVRVDVAAAYYLTPASTFLRPLLIGVGIALGAVIALAAIVLIAIRWPRRERPASSPQPVTVIAAPAPAPQPTSREAVAEALRVYRTAPADGALIRLRAALFIAAGVRPGTTLRDALASAANPALRAALMAAERAAFGPAPVRDAASNDLVTATENWLQ